MRNVKGSRYYFHVHISIITLRMLSDFEDAKSASQNHKVTKSFLYHGIGLLLISKIVSEERDIFKVFPQIMLKRQACDAMNINEYLMDNIPQSLLRVDWNFPNS